MKTNFIIFSQSRSGSSLLQELIDSHPEIKCEAEIFNLDHGYVGHPIYLKVWKKLPYSFIYYRRLRSVNELYGFKLFYDQLLRPARVIHILHKMGWKIIYLKRNNIIRQVISEIIATDTAQWHRTEDDTMNERKFHISVDKFIAGIAGRLALRETESNILRTLPHFTLNYEESLENKADWQNSLNNVFQYLGVKEAFVQSKLRKMYDRPYSEMIQNHDELLEAIKNTKYSKLLGEFYE